MLRKLLFTIVLLCCGMLASAAPVRKHVMGQGGNTAANGAYRVQSTIGQAVAGLTNPRATIRAGIGFWYLVPEDTVATSTGTPRRAVANRLDQNSPNPFNPVTTISFSVAQDGPVRLTLYNVQGERVASLVDEPLGAGEHSLVFRPTDLASGVYFYRLETAGFSESRRLLLLK